MELNDTTLKQLAAWSDATGVLSAFVGFPAAAGSERPTAPIELKNAVAAVWERARAGLPHDRWALVRRRLDELTPELERLGDPTRHGRGRALFVGLSDGRLETLSVQLPLPTRVVVRGGPHLVPLLAVLETGRPSGLVAVQRDGLALLEWRLGTIDDLERMPFEPDESEWREKRGPASPNPVHGQQGATHAERFDRRLEANRERFFKRAAGRLEELSRARGWSRLAFFGDARLGHTLIDALPVRNDDFEVLVDDRVIGEVAQDLLADSASRMLREAQARRELELVERVKDAGLTARGRGAVGLPRVLECLNEGRVDRLVLDAAASFSGFVSQRGLLYPPDAPPGDGEARREPELCEPMIVRALGTEARVTAVGETAGQALRALGGVGALLRW